MTRNKNGKKALDTILTGSFALQGTQLLSRPRTPANLIGTTTGFVGLTVAGVTAQTGADIITRSLERAKPRRKKKRR